MKTIIVAALALLAVALSPAMAQSANSQSIPFFASMYDGCLFKYSPVDAPDCQAAVKRVMLRIDEYKEKGLDNAMYAARLKTFGADFVYLCAKWDKVCR